MPYIISTRWLTISGLNTYKSALGEQSQVPLLEEQLKLITRKATLIVAWFDVCDSRCGSPLSL